MRFSRTGKWEGGGIERVEDALDKEGSWLQLTFETIRIYLWGGGEFLGALVDSKTLPQDLWLFVARSGGDALIT